MTLMLMRQHLAAAVWHVERAVEEAPSVAAFPPVIHALWMANGHVIDLDYFGIDRGHVVEQSRGETHLAPGDDDDDDDDAGELLTGEPE